jgi:two-component sensor histidine kinase
MICKKDYIVLFLLFLSFSRITIEAQEQTHNSVILGENIYSGLTNFNSQSNYFKILIKEISWYDSNKKITVFRNNVTLNKSSKSTLPYNNAFVRFEFKLSENINSEFYTFRYKLFGLHSDWRTFNNSELLFTNLPPGDYNLKIIASEKYNNLNYSTIILPISVNQVYYKRWWFLTSLVLFIGLILFFVRKYELNHINKMEQLRLRISRDLHDELGSSLTGIAMKSDILLSNINANSKKKILEEISDQSRSAVDTLSDIVWAIDSRNNTLEDLSDRMKSTMYQFLSPLNISCKFNSPIFDKQLEINQSYRQHVFLIFKEAITNIMKHSNATEVNISLTIQKNKMKLVILENGTISKNKNEVLNGNGIKNMNLRATKINGELSISIDNGYCIELVFFYV